ncbi:AbiV family abortive infection protein [uncultured Tenacibaculum sp.]|uniref:AbiV family abortive infection protein n=1 Tax=uncultured Tenacibaculum sp. TaxID=174713 RepID=UPI00261FCCBF|nr:AbiV family abortive infection protein [uncultured Tenacibaculum sp.]
MIKKFPNLTPEESKSFDKLIYKNALQLKKDAISIASIRKSYSSATSLLILSSEEVIKSILVLLHAEGYNVYKLKETHKFFFDHKIRHHIAQLIEMGSGIIKSMIRYDEQEPTKLLKTKIKWLDNFVNGTIDIINAARPIIDANDRIKKLQKFNELKNKGLYVDYKNNIILPQNEITENTYKETLKITENIFSFYKGLRILFNPALKNRVNNAEIDKGKELLKDLIDEGLKDFSFKELNKL